MGKMVTDALYMYVYDPASTPRMRCISPLKSVKRVKTRSRARFHFWPHFWKSLIAILAGNAIYFLLLSPRLPAYGQHAPGRIDLGLLIDFWACLACFGILELVLKFGGKDQRSG
jgi:hypothetical protein